MAWIALILSILSICLGVYAVIKSTQLVKELEDETQ